MQPLSDGPPNKIAGAGTASPSSAAWRSDDLIGTVDEDKLPATLLNEVFRQELLDHGPALYVADLTGQLIWANTGFRRLTAVAGGKLFPIDQIAAEVALLGSMVFRDDNLRLGDATQRLRSRHVGLRDEAGQITAIAGVVQALPEESSRLEAIASLRERNEDVMRLVSDWVWETDADLKLVDMSNRVTELLGYHPRELIGQNLLTITSSDAARAAVEQRFQRHSPFRNQPAEFTTKSGDLKTVLLSAVPIFNFATGALSGFRGTASDITELRKREIGLRAAKDMAETSSRAKTEFLANMSHELRTPLNAIIGFSEVMHMELLGPIGNQQYHGYVGDIHDSARHLLGLINDILDVSKIEAGRAELSESTIEIRAVFDSVTRLIRERALRAELQLVSYVQPNLPLLVADERKLKQILINLLSNSVKFTPAGGTIRMAAELDKIGDLMLTVADSGVGIDAADIKTVMEPFGQVDTSVNRKHHGTGLGLPLTKGLVELHGGSFNLASEPGAGTTVTIRLPASRLKR